MGSWKALRISGFALIAVVATAAGYVLDRHRATAVETERALRWARQVATQVDSLALRAREKGEDDPYGWSVGHLTLGAEPRFVKIARLPEDAARQLPEEELFTLDRSKGTFEMTKLLDPSKGEAVRVWIDTGYSGYLGTKFRVTNDLAVAGTCIAYFAFLFLGSAAMRKRRDLIDRAALQANLDAPVPTSTIEEKPTAPAAAAPAPAPVKDTRYEELLLSTSGWNRRAQSGLTQLAVGVRDLLAFAAQISRNAGASREQAMVLQASLKQGLEELQMSRSALKTAARLSAQSDALFRKAQTPENLRMIETALARIKELCSQGESAVQKFEASFEPWTNQVQGTIAAIESSVQATQALSPAITTTRGALGQFSREFRELESFFPSPENADESPDEPKSSIWAQDDAVIGVSEVPGHQEPPLPRRKKSRKAA